MYILKIFVLFTEKKNEDTHIFALGKRYFSSINGTYDYVHFLLFFNMQRVKN